MRLGRSESGAGSSINRRLGTLVAGVVGLALGLSSVELGAQLMQLSDSTFATKVALYTLAGTQLNYNTGLIDTSTLRVTVATDDEINDSLAAIQTSVQLSDNALFVDDADFTDATSSLIGVGGVAESAAPTTVTEGDMGMFAMTLNRALKVTLYNSSGTELTSGDVTEDAAETAGGTGPFVLSVRRNVAASSAGTTGDNASFNTDALGLLWTRHLDPCDGVAKVPVSIDIVTATTTEIINADASNKAYICSIVLYSAGTGNIALIEDATDACASPTAGLMGGVTAAEGFNFVAQSGISAIGGSSTIAQTSATNMNVCLISSAAVQISGTVVYVYAP